MPPVQPAGPSRSRVTNFFSDDEDADTGAASGSEQVPLVAARLKRKAAAEPEVGKKKSKNKKEKGGKNDAVNGKSDKGGKGDKSAAPSADDAAAVEKRAKVAAELLKTRCELPFYQGRQNILDEIMAHDTVVIIGETGCGKSTQLGQLLRRQASSLQHFGARGPSVAITQPRRLPCISLATRVAAEMGVAVGAEVGYAVRFEDATSRDTRVKFMTEGVLMRELANAGERTQPNGDGAKAAANGKATAPKAKTKSTEAKDDNEGDDESEDETDTSGLNLLTRYDVVVIDEAHERTLNTDFLLGSMKKIQQIRKARAAKGEGRELKIVIMSATLDPGKFTNFFDGCPALHVPGRMFDVTTSHTAAAVDDFIEAAAVAAMMVHNRKPAPPGEMLIFMPGSDEIENLCALLKRRSGELPPDAHQLQVLPLYASLPPTAQAKIFAPLPPKTRRIVVATNIAETSLTIPGIAFVIDSGYKKEKEYIYRASGAIEHLRKMKISQASAWQRTGRAGREMPGECFRLYTEPAFKSMTEFDTPEIQRCNLSNAVLQLIAMRQDPFTFAYIDPPSRDSVAAAFRSLAGLGAIASPTDITPLGREMLKYPLDPEHARILVAGFELGCASEIIDILSLVVTGPVFLDRVQDARETAAAARAKFIHRDGDHLTAMNVLRAYLALKEQRDDDDDDDEEGEGDDNNKSAKPTKPNKQQKQRGSRGGLAQWCRDNHVNGKTLTAATKVRSQLRELAARHGRDYAASCGSEYSAVGRALLQGLFMNTAVIQSDGSYRQAAGSLQVKIHPSSVLVGRKVPAIVYDELAITSAIYARNVSAFEQHWLTEVPWFARAAGTAVAAPVTRKKV